MKFQCRAVKPKETECKEVEAETPEEAANEFHSKYNYLSEVIVVDDRVDNQRTKIGLTYVEVRGYTAWVSRMFYRGIWRKGGVRPWGRKSFEDRLKEAAKAVGWERDPMELVEEGWIGEHYIYQEETCLRTRPDR